MESARVWTWQTATRRTVMGSVVIGPHGLIVIPEDDYYCGVMSPEDAVELARAILDRFAPHK
jgi:hypothetical protein